MGKIGLFYGQSYRHKQMQFNQRWRCSFSFFRFLEREAN